MPLFVCMNTTRTYSEEEKKLFSLTLVKKVFYYKDDLDMTARTYVQAQAP